MITQVSKEVFENTEGVSYSKLFKLAESPKAYQLALAEEPVSSAISIGSAVDIMLTQPENFEKEIYVMSASKPESEMMKIFSEIYAETGDASQAYMASGFKISQDKVLTKFNTEGKEYHDALLKAGYRKILDIEDLFKVNQIVNSLKDNIYTKKYFIKEDGVELIFQPYIIWDLVYYSLVEEHKLKNTKAKSVLDIVRIDHKNKVIQPIELKTGEEGFMRSYWRFKRYLQGAMYTTALNKAVWDKEDIAEQYEIENIRFIYADTKLYYPPVIYKMTSSDVHYGTVGRCWIDEEGRHGKIKYKGYTQLAAELEWHKANNLWDYSYDIYMNNGEIDIDAFSIKF